MPGEGQRILVDQQMHLANRPARIERHDADRHDGSIMGPHGRLEGR